jgi:hypothetical protein
MRKERTISVAGDVWSWRVGATYLVIRDPKRKSTIVPINEVLGISVEAFERGRRKKTKDGAVTPHDIASYIERKLR